MEKVIIINVNNKHYFLSDNNNISINDFIAYYYSAFFGIHNNRNNLQLNIGIKIS